LIFFKIKRTTHMIGIGCRYISIAFWKINFMGETDASRSFGFQTWQIIKFIMWTRTIYTMLFTCIFYFQIVYF
jgi:hypothetical protein